MFQSGLEPEIADRIIATHPLPIADAVALLESSSNPHEQRDRVVEAFRAVLRFVSALVMAARAQTGPQEEEASRVADHLCLVRSRHLTEGQWWELVRELLRPWRRRPGEYPLQELVKPFGPSGSNAKKIDALLRMRRAETVAHHTTGDIPEVLELLQRRVEQLEALVLSLEPLWHQYRLVVPLERPLNTQERQAAWRLMGATHGTGRWRRVPLAPGVREMPGHPMLVDGDGRPRLRLHPVVTFRKPASDKAERLFILDGGDRKGARYMAYPQMCAHHDPEASRALDQSLFVGLGVASEVEGAPETPYRGLDAFREQDAAFFFGRERQAQILANKLRRQPLTTVTGPSGSGKSSLLRAGVLPHVQDYTALTLRPGPRPASNLRRRVNELRRSWWKELSERDEPGDEDERNDADWKKWHAEVLELLAPDAAVEPGKALDDWATLIDRRAMLVIDQAEELITACKDAEERNEACALLASLVENDQSPTRIAICVREDFAARLARLPALGPLVLRHVELVTLPQPHDLTRAIVRPAEALGFRFEHEVIEAMIAEVEDQPAALSLLQFCALRMWEKRDRVNRVMTEQSYEQLGGVLGALASHADDVYERMPTPRKKSCRDLFRGLVAPDNTRRVLTVTTALALAGGGPDAPRLLEKLVDSRLVTAREGEDDASGPRYEIAHESLALHWDKLGLWLRKDPEQLERIQGLRDAASSWDKSGRQPGLLWHGEEVAKLVGWTSVTEDPLLETERAFVDACAAHEGRRAWTQRSFTVLVFALVAIGAIATTFLWLQAEKANDKAVERQAKALVEGARTAAAEGMPHKARAMLRTSLRLADSAEAVALVEELQAQPLLLQKLEAGATAVAFTPDGLSLLVGGHQQSFMRFDTTTGERSVPGQHEHAARVLTAAPQGSKVAVGDAGGGLALWDLDQGEATWLEGHELPINCASFSSTGQLLATGDQGGNIQLWRVPSGERAVALVGHTGRITSLAFDPAGGQLASASEDGTVRLWDPATGQEFTRLDDALDQVADVAFHPSGHFLLIAEISGRLGYRDGRQGWAPRWTRPASADPLYTLAFHPNGESFVTAGQLGEATAWSADDGERLWTRSLHEREVWDLAFDPSGEHLASGGGNGVVRIWRYDALSAPPGEERQRAPLLGLGSSPHEVVTVANDGELRFSSFRDANQLRRYQPMTEGVWSFASDLAQGRLAIGDAGGVVRVLDAETGTVDRIYHGHGDWVVALAFGPGPRLASAGYDGSVLWWDLDSGQVLRHIEEPGRATLALSGDGTLLATAGEELPRLRVWRTDDRELALHIEDVGQGIRALAISAAKDRIAVGLETGTVRVHAFPSGDLLSTYETEATPRALAFSPDGRILASNAGASDILMRQLETGEETRLTGHRDEVTGLVFDGTALLSSSFDGTTRRWNLPEGSPEWRGVAFLTTPWGACTHAGWEGTPDREPTWARAVRERGRTTASSPRGELLCLGTDTAVELWDLSKDERMATADAIQPDQLVAREGACAWLEPGGEATELSASGTRSVLGQGVRALGPSQGGIVMATDDGIVLKETRGETKLEGPRWLEPSSILADGERVLVGYTSGRVAVVSVPARAAVEDRSPPDGAAEVTALATGPRATLAVGYANGELVLSNLAHGHVVTRRYLHGSVEHLQFHQGVLHALTDLGDSATLTFAARDRCAAIADLHQQAPVHWDQGAIALAGPPTSPPCEGE